MRYLLANNQSKVFTLNGAALEYRLPSDYIEVEYIENTSTALLNTGISGLSEWHITAQMVTATSTSSVLIATSSTNADWAGSHPTVSNAWCVNYNSGYTTVSSLSKTDLVINYETNRKLTLTAGGETCTATRSSNRSATAVVYLFGCSNAATSYPFKGRVYGDVIGKKNGEVVFLGIPCRSTSDGVGLYDVIGKSFHASTRTQKFIAGPDKYDSAVEYLESSGTQYIDTGLIGDSELDYEITFKIITGGGTFQNILGDRYSSSSRRYSLMAALSSYQRYYYNCGDNNQIDSPRNSYTSDVTTARKTGLDVYLRDSLIGTFAQQTFTTPSSIILFGARNDGALSNAMYGYIYSASFSRNGTVVRDFIPVRVGQVGYMYDRVSGRLFPNSGTGSFVIGPDVVNSN